MKFATRALIVAGLVGLGASAALAGDGQDNRRIQNSIYDTIEGTPSARVPGVLEGRSASEGQILLEGRSAAYGQAPQHEDFLYDRKSSEDR